MQIETEKQKFIDKIAKKLSASEDERKKRILKLVVKQIVALVIFYFSFNGIVFFGENHLWMVTLSAFIALLSFVAFIYNFSDDNKDLKKFLKRKVKSQILKSFNLETLNGKVFTDDMLRKSNLFSLYSYQETDDVIKGCYNNVDYTIAETKLVARSRNNEFDVFKGVIISFKSNKKILAETLITSKDDKNIRNYPPNLKDALIVFLLWIPFSVFLLSIYFLGIYLRKSDSVNTIDLTFVQSLLLYYITPLMMIFAVGIPFVYLMKKIISDVFYKMKKMQDVKLEDTTFDERFNVYTQDQIEARYILTPVFMERLKSLETSFGTKNIKCSFFDDNIMFAISTNKDLFELGSLYKSIKSKKSIEEFYNQIKSIQDMVKHFKLNEKTGL